MAAPLSTHLETLCKPIINSLFLLTLKPNSARLNLKSQIKLMTKKETNYINFGKLALKISRGQISKARRIKTKLSKGMETKFCSLKQTRGRKKESNRRMGRFLKI